MRKNLKLWVVVYCVLQFSINSYSQRIPFTCKMFSEILKEIDQQKKRLVLYDSLKGKWFIASDSTSGTPYLVNRSNLSDRVLDSLVKNADLIHIVDDSLYHMRSSNYIVDTFGIFTSQCNCMKEGKHYIFLNDYDSSKIPSGANIIVVKGAAVKNNDFVIVLRSNRNKIQYSSLAFYFHILGKTISIDKVRWDDEGD